MSLSVLRHLLCMALLLILAGCDGGNLKTEVAGFVETLFRFG